MNVTLIDRIGAVVLQNGIMRVDCFAAGPNGQEAASGRLLIPATQASAVLQSLVAAAQELDRRLREQSQQPPAPAASAPATDATAAATDKPSRAKDSKDSKDKKARADG